MAEQKQIVEEAVEIAAEQLDVVEKSASLLKRIIWNHRTHVGVAFAVGAGLGSAVTYKVVKDKLTYRFDQLLTEEVEKTKEHYSRKNLTGEFADPVSAAKALIPEEERVVAKEGLEALRNYQGVEVDQEVDITAESIENVDNIIAEEIKRGKAKNIFENSVEDFDWDAEMKHRDSISDADPYVITFEEYSEDDELEEMQLTYLEGEADLTIIDENNSPIENVDAVVGEDNLKFGYGSKDGNIVYIRNPRIGVNMEIIRSTGTYASDVLGLADEETELRHSNRRPKKFRVRDE